MLNLANLPIEFLQPFRHLELTGVLNHASAQLLRQAFPKALEVTARNSGTDKTYIVANKRLLGTDGTRRTRSPLWNQFLDAVLGAEYRDYLTKATAIPLDQALVEVDVNAYAASSYMSAHTDRPEKLLSHIIYLNPFWREEWEGRLGLLDGPNGHLVRKINPQWPISVILPRSDQSWHTVAPVAEGCPMRRLTIQISFFLRQPRSVAAGRFKAVLPQPANTKRGNLRKHVEPESILPRKEVD